MISIAVWIAIFLVTVVVHEFCHGYVAYLLGDPTAKQAGRLTFNPLKHIDPFWTVIFPAMLFYSTGGRFLIGMAKPVPVNFGRLRNPKRDMIWVALAGPAANLLLAVVLNIFWKLTQSSFLLTAIYFNLGIALFNLLPIPPLDGSRILTGLLPMSLARQYLKVEPYGFVIVLLLYLSGTLLYILIPMIDLVCRVLDIMPISYFLALMSQGLA